MTHTTEVLKQAHLRYSIDTQPGFSRMRKGGRFEYYDEMGMIIRDEGTLERIKKLGIPPAWEDVWVCAAENGHLQATGKDARGRKQYRYHSDWNLKRQEQKFFRILEFAKLLPKVRRRVQLDMRKAGLPREKVLATIVYLLENTLIRVGNEEYVEENKSYGLTTLQRRHVDIEGSEVNFEFKGKSGVYHSVSIRDLRVANIIRKCQELPGQDLFEYLDKNGDRQKICSEDVNDYLKAITGKEITAKNFRTWAGTNIAAEILDKRGCCREEKEIKKTISETVKSVSSRLRNKPNTCRKYYIHPSILEAYSKGEVLSKYSAGKNIRELNECENCVLRMLGRLEDRNQ